MRTQVVTPDSLHSSVERLYGFNFIEDSGSAAYITLREGSSSGTVVKHLNIPANGTVDMALGKGTYWEFPGGCYVNEESGSVAGTLYY